ncbi:MAG TPA: hypothetical protein EYP61_02150 [Candidatus Latescibacteria bacterium]|nr:hypothetical protein [Candidatus Latescibacterota bacterium]
MRYVLTTLIVVALAAPAGAQLMGSGHWWPYSSEPHDGGIPYVGDNPPVIDGVLEDWELEQAYEIWWGPSIITEWGDKYGYNRGPDYTPDRVKVGAAGGLDNNLALGDEEDASEKATDKDWFGHFWFSWDEDYFYVSARIQDNVFDIIGDPEKGDWAFWTRDGFFLEWDLAGNGGTTRGPDDVAVYLHPMNIDEAVYSMQTWGAGEEGEEGNHMYGTDPDFFRGSQLAGGPTEEGYVVEAAIAWDLLLRGAPELKDEVVREGHKFNMTLICPDPDGGPGYGQTFWGRSYGDFMNDMDWWPDFYLAGPRKVAVEAETWGRIKAMQK